jgi:hypothetical protein
MKFNFKKIASVLASTVMLSSTIALAAAATLPAPFVQSGKADVAVVVGSTAAETDMAAAVDVQSYLVKELNKQAGIGTASSASTVVGGDSVQLYKENNKINVGQNLNSVYSSLDNDELSTVLADGVYEDDDGTEYDYEQSITLMPLNLTHFADSEVDETEKPVIGFDVASNAAVLNYTLDFTDKPSNSSDLMETTTIKMLGREYYISDVDASSSNLKLTLLDTANTETVYEDEPVTITVGDKTYEVSLVSASEGTTNKATLMVNGEKLDSTNEGNSRKIAADTYLSVLDVYEGTREKDRSYAEISIGTGQIVLENGQNVEINDDTIDDLTTYLTVSSGKLSSINLAWITEDEQFLVPGEELVLPGFETIKLSMAGFVASDPETLGIENSGDNYIQLKGLALKDGSVSSLPLLYSNSSNTGFAGLGKDSTHVLASSTGNTLSLNDTKHQQFVVTYESGDDSASYAFELVSINEEDSGSKNVTKIRNLANDEDSEFDNNDDADFGDINLAVSAQNGDLGTATLTATHSGSSSGVTFDRVITEKGLSFRLPIDTVSIGDNVLNITGAQSNTTDTRYEPTSWVMNFSEADDDNSNIGLTGAGIPFTVTLNFGGTDNKIQVGTHSISPKLSVDEDSDDTESYVPGEGSHATKLVVKDDDQDTLDLEYHAEEAYADVLIAESSAVISTDGNSSSSSGVMVVKDSEASSVSTKNLVVVGGSCVNTVAADLLGLTGAACGADWEAKTGVGAGSYLIQTFSRSSGKVATLVAGYNAPDTTNAAKAFTTQTVDATAGKKYTGTVATAITPVTTSS